MIIDRVKVVDRTALSFKSFGGKFAVTVLVDDPTLSPLERSMPIGLYDDEGMAKSVAQLINDSGPYPNIWLIEARAKSVREAFAQRRD